VALQGGDRCDRSRGSGHTQLVQPGNRSNQLKTRVIFFTACAGTGGMVCVTCAAVSPDPRHT
jgi:hypothetical protein